MFRTLANAWTHLHQLGPRETWNYAVERSIECYHEYRFGITTTGKILPSTLGIDSPFSSPYYPSDYRSIYSAFRHLKIQPEGDAFLDYGSGMGRLLVVAASYPFRRVIGVELSSQLCEIARRNLHRAQRKLRCPSTEVICGDATEYQVPEDVTVIFFYNPFHGSVLLKALAAIHQSLERHPRPIRIIFKNTTFLEPLLDDHPWLVKITEYPAFDGDHKIMVLDARPRAAGQRHGGLAN